MLPKYDVKGIIHITGGGFFENIPRILPEGTAAKIQIGTWEVPPIFPYIKKCGNIDKIEMFSTYNMGVGMMMIVEAKDANSIVKALREAGETADIIGQIVKTDGDKVILEDK